MDTIGLAQTAFGQCLPYKRRSLTNVSFGYYQAAEHLFVDTVFRLYVEVLTAAKMCQEFGIAMDHERVSDLKNFVGSRRENQGVLALQSHHGEVQGRAQSAFGNGPAGKQGS